jgi:hypothetical protein
LEKNRWSNVKISRHDRRVFDRLSATVVAPSSSAMAAAHALFDGSGKLRPETDAQDALEAAEELQAKWAEWEANAPSGEHYVERKAVDDAALAVIHASGWPARLLAEAREAHERAFHTRAALRIFADAGVYPKDPVGQVGEVSSFLWGRMNLPSFSGDVEYLEWRTHPGARLWAETIEALRQDPDAPLPE